MKTQNTFYISKAGSYSGPFSAEEVFAKIESYEHSWTDYIYDDGKQDWVLVLEHPLFADKFNSNLGKKMAKTPDSSNKGGSHKEKAWYILKDGNNYGPFSQLEIIQMLQEKALYEYDFIWHQKMASWKRVADVSEYSNEEIRKLKGSLPSDLSEVFFRRRYMRAQYGCSIVVHNNKSVFRGQSIEISAGGAGLIIENSEIEPGQTLFLHFQPGDGVPPFNAVCTVVSKKFVKEQSGPSSLMKYGVKFTSISSAIKEQIKEFTQSSNKAA